MALVTDLLDRLKQLQSDRSQWEKFWLDVARYVLPDAERFDRMFASPVATSSVTNAVVTEPVAVTRGREIYDQTSLWAVDRGAAGTLALVTPQTGTWHDLTNDDPFGAEPSDEEQLWYEDLRDYLFRARSNPRSGFWVNHKASLRCLWGFGTSVMFIGDAGGNPRAPISYQFVPISENHLATNFEGVPDTNFRLFTRSAKQCVERWGTRCSEKTQKAAESDKDRDKPIALLHAVQPRMERGSYGNTNRDSAFISCYVEVDEKHLLSESGFYEFPYRVDYWQRNSNAPYAEGPISLALADIKSLNMLSKTALRAAQQSVDPPIATHSTVDGIPLNLNPRAVNPGYMSSDGKLLAQPIVTARPDFAEVVLETKRQQVRTTTYIDLWTTIIDSTREQTAYEVMIKNQERADMIGPVGTSLQMGLSFQIEREIGILERIGAFYPGSPLAPPESLGGTGIGVRFTSPLDKARRLNEFQATRQLWAFAAEIAAVDPSVLDKLDGDESIDLGQEVLGAPQRIMTDDEAVAEIRRARAEQQANDAAIERTAALGVAGQEMGKGANELAASPASQEIIKSLAGVQ